jgi:hypothetical protein
LAQRTRCLLQTYGEYLVVSSTRPRVVLGAGTLAHVEIGPVAKVRQKLATTCGQQPNT